jgi:hypothetical protein
VTPGRRIIAALMIVALSVVANGCHETHPNDEPMRLPWQEISLPPPTAAGERVTLRAGAVCAGRWFLTGAIVSANGTPRPAVWTSTDAKTWTTMTLAPKTYYGRLNTIYSAGCRDGRVAAIGDKTGGVHGNPRTSSWHHEANGVLSEVIAYFEQYGGNNAVNVSRIAGGPAGWVIAGNRASGAAAWISPDAADFRLVEGAPGLANDKQVKTRAVDVVAASGGWMILGAVTAVGSINQDPAAWISADGLAWRRIEVPGTTEYEELQRAVTVGDQVVAIGPQGDAFGAWRGDGSSWRAIGRFGASGGPGRGFAEALTAAGGRLFAAVSDGAAYSVWQSSDSGSGWHLVSLPAQAPSGFGMAAVVIGNEHQLLLIMNDGRASRAWTARVGAGT